MPSLKQYSDAMAGRVLDDVIVDVPPLNHSSKENLPYVDQKPQILYRRLIAATTDPGDWVLDPFSGSGTTLAAAEELGRRWVGIDLWDGGGSTTQGRMPKGVDVVVWETPPIRTDSS